MVQSKSCESIFHTGFCHANDRLATAFLALGLTLVADSAPVAAGMPNPSLTDFATPNASLTEAASMRLQSISFFLMVFLLLVSRHSLDLELAAV